MFWSESPRDVVHVAGSDAATYLHSQLSQNIVDLAVGASAWSFLLQPAGKIDVLLRVWRTAADTFVLDTDAGFGETMVARLNRFKIRVKAEVSPLDWQCIAIRGGPVAGVDAAVVGWGGGVDLLGADVEPPPGFDHATGTELEDSRVAAGWPAMGSEIVPGDTIPAETGISAMAVSFTKGCYPGQELVERMDSRGAAAPKHLAVFERRPGDVAGTDISVDGQIVGAITSVGSTHVIASVRRGIKPGTRD